MMGIMDIERGRRRLSLAQEKELEKLFPSSLRKQVQLCILQAGQRLIALE